MGERCKLPHREPLQVTCIITAFQNHGTAILFINNNNCTWGLGKRYVCVCGEGGGRIMGIWNHGRSAPEYQVCSSADVTPPISTRPSEANLSLLVDIETNEYSNTYKNYLRFIHPNDMTGTFYGACDAFIFPALRHDSVSAVD